MNDIAKKNLFKKLPELDPDPEPNTDLVVKFPDPIGSVSKTLLFTSFCFPISLCFTPLRITPAKSSSPPPPREKVLYGFYLQFRVLSAR
jgi:hypothetical protein